MHSRALFFYLTRRRQPRDDCGKHETPTLVTHLKALDILFRLITAQAALILRPLISYNYDIAATTPTFREFDLTR